MSIRRMIAAAMIASTVVLGAGTAAFARNGADDPPGDVRHEHHHGQVEHGANHR